jgi:hypothetical protein
MMSTYSKNSFTVALLAGVTVSALGVYGSLERLRGFTEFSRHQIFHSLKASVGLSLKQSIDWTIAPTNIQFVPQPNPEPSGTGGTGTR